MRVQLNSFDSLYRFTWICGRPAIAKTCTTRAAAFARKETRIGHKVKDKMAEVKQHIMPLPTESSHYIAHNSLHKSTSWLNSTLIQPLFACIWSGVMKSTQKVRPSPSIIIMIFLIANLTSRLNLLIVLLSTYVPSLISITNLK